MPELHDPLDSGRRRALRRLVLTHVLSEHRRHHLPLVHVADPGGSEWIVPAVPVEPDEPDDHALRTDVLAALFRRTTGRDAGDPAAGREVVVWITRTGALDLQDIDAAWLAAASGAAAEAALDLTLVVVNRHGWRDPRTGAEAIWKRLRER